MIYNEWGFVSSPFQTTSLPPSDLGERLLVGREKEISSLIRKIESGPKLATLEGLNGVGKTSLVNVASYRLFKTHVNSRRGPLYLPCRKIFQLNPEQDVQSFVDQVLMEIAQTLIEQSQQFKAMDISLKTEAISRWLNSPQLVSYQGGIWVVQAGRQQETNTSSGFERSVFRKAVLSWLEAIFPTPESGAVICTIDNLELLQASETARALLERLRDELFTVRGVSWVLCGALGIVYGVVASPRLEGYLHKPIEIGEMNVQHAPEILTSRVSALSQPGSQPYLPLLASDFAFVYELLHGNLRSVLSFADDYCQWTEDQGRLPAADEDKKASFTRWLTDQTASAYEAVRKELRPKALEVFNTAVKLDGVFSPGEYESFGFNSIPAFRPHIRDLEAVGLLVSTQDDSDKRRKTIQVTPKGWMINYHLQNAHT